MKKRLKPVNAKEFAAGLKCLHTCTRGLKVTRGKTLKYAWEHMGLRNLRLDDARIYDRIWLCDSLNSPLEGDALYRITFSGSFLTKKNILAAVPYRTILKLWRKRFPKGVPNERFF